jgi:Ca2+-transporting ATPase
MAVQCAEGDSHPLYFVKGSLDVLLEHCTAVFVSPSQQRPLTPTVRNRLQEVAESFASEGYRVLALAEGRELSTLSIVGLVAIADHPRPGVLCDVVVGGVPTLTHHRLTPPTFSSEAIRALQDSKVRVCMITGDMRATAEAIARQLGFFDPLTHTSMSGDEVSRRMVGVY